MAATIALAVVSVGTQQARADFAFGVPRNLGPHINSGLCEYDPAISADGLELYYSSCRPGTYGVQDLWVLRRATTQDEWSAPQNLGPALNNAAQQLGPCLSADGLSLYFSTMDDEGLGAHDIYVTKRVTRDGSWGPPVSLGPGINTTSDDVNPYITPDGLTMFFSEAEWGTPVRPGGSGQSDLWMVTRGCPCSPWDEPVNLGRIVNSSAVDGAPSLSHDGLVLFFNSNRAGGVGQWDIWISTRKTTQDPWGLPVNAGAPVNSEAWDGNASLSADGRTLYYSSARGGSVGYTDLWEVQVNPIVDFDGDGKVDEHEVQIMTASLGTDDPVCDIGPTPFGDGVVDMKDMAVLTQYSSAQVIDPTLLACWTFDETQGDIACDSTEFWTGTLVGNPLWQPEAGAVGGALQLDGLDDHVVAGAPLDVSRGVWSLFAWVKGGKPGQVVLSQSNGVNWLVADPAAGALRTDLRSATRTSRTLSSQTVITDGNWHRIGMTWDGATRKLFVDDKLVAEDTQDFIKPAYGNVHIGADKNLASGSFWSGLIDDVRIYDRVVKP